MANQQGQSLVIDSFLGRSFGKSLGWAVFLGCSWTWCIGMFLPVLLVRDFGVAGWIVFAVPNVLGAAAMGWVVRSPASSRRIVENHTGACLAFSTVTVLFHIFFLEWLVGRLVGQPVLFAYLLAYVGFLAARKNAGAVLQAAMVFAVSAVAFVLLYAHGSHWTAPPLIRNSAALAWLAPVSVFGFALSPYLDLTFHRARQATGPVEARVAFGVGFGVFFAAMILFSLWYAPALVRRVGLGGPIDLLAAIIGIHMLVQSAFTIAAHLASVAALRPERARPPSPAVWGIGLVALVLIVAGTLINRLETAQTYHGVGWGEVVYRVFMGFYGLGFPAYVWLCMLPFRGGRPTGSSLRVLAIAVVLAAPLFWMGFVEGQTMWLIAGLAIVLGARGLIRVRADVPGPGRLPARHLL